MDRIGTNQAPVMVYHQTPLLVPISGNHRPAGRTDGGGVVMWGVMWGC